MGWLLWLYSLVSVSWCSAWWCLGFLVVYCDGLVAGLLIACGLFVMVIKMMVLLVLGLGFV